MASFLFMQSPEIKLYKESQKELQWFKDIFGFDESPESVMENIVVEETGDNINITSKANNITYNAGHFKLRSPYTFNLTPRGGGKLHIISGNGHKSKLYEYVDVLTAQNHEEFEGATFQLASNFNCLEFPAKFCTAKDGIVNYWGDPTQGPTCAIACPAALLYRNYLIKHSDGTIGQFEKEIQLLERTPLTLEHGKVIINENEVERLSNLDFDWSNPENYQVGVQRNCQVVLTRNPDNFIKYQKVEQNKIVHHVFAASLAFGSYAIKNDFTLNIASNILYSEYKSTILAGWENSILYPNHAGSNKLFLTLVGAASFSNPINIVCEAIKRNKDVIVDSGLDVYLVCFSQNSFECVSNILSDVVKETEGSIIQTGISNKNQKIFCQIY